MNVEADWGTVFVALQAELKAMVSPFDACAVAVIDLQAGTTTFHHVTAAGEHVYRSHPRLWPAMRQALVSGQPVYRPTRAAIAAMADGLDTALVGSVLDVPFSHGTLSISTAAENAFSDADIAVLLRFAPVLSEAQRRLLDITERQCLAAEVEQQRVQALEVRRLTALGEMAAGVAHELNQPLNGIRAFAEGWLYGMKQGWSTSIEETAQVLGDIVNQVDRITVIVDHMRTFARDTSQADPVAVRLREVADGALKLVGAQLRSYGVEVIVDVPAGLPAVLGHANQIEQVVLNLLGNARDAVIAQRDRAPSGWRPLVRLSAAAVAASAEVCLGVEDNGGGVPADIVDRVFDPFFTTKDVGKGTGLGLAIAREIAVKHGGSLTLANQPGTGATFWMRLPVAPPSAAINPVAG
jgi:C4-dicarboxylate-specific signal transduction histidine kinase